MFAFFQQFVICIKTHFILYTVLLFKKKKRVSNVILYISYQNCGRKYIIASFEVSFFREKICIVRIQILCHLFWHLFLIKENCTDYFRTHGHVLFFSCFGNQDPFIVSTM